MCLSLANRLHQGKKEAKALGSGMKNCMFDLSDCFPSTLTTWATNLGGYALDNLS